MSRCLVLVGVAAGLAAFAAVPAQATIVQGGSLYASSATIEIMTIYENAAHGHRLSLLAGGDMLSIDNPAGGGAKFGNSTATFRQSIGTASPGALLAIELTDLNTGVAFGMGPNGGPDGLSHAWVADAAGFNGFNSLGNEVTYEDLVAYFSGDPVSTNGGSFDGPPEAYALAFVQDPTAWFIGWEDLCAGGAISACTGSDYDYNDVIFVVRGASIAVPEPETMVLFGMGLIGLGLVRRHRVLRQA